MHTTSQFNEPVSMGNRQLIGQPAQCLKQACSLEIDYLHARLRSAKAPIGMAARYAADGEENIVKLVVTEQHMVDGHKVTHLRLTATGRRALGWPPLPDQAAERPGGK